MKVRTVLMFAALLTTAYSLEEVRSLRRKLSPAKGREALSPEDHRELFLDDTLEDSFPASDSPNWSSSKI